MEPNIPSVFLYLSLQHEEGLLMADSQFAGSLIEYGGDAHGTHVKINSETVHDSFSV